MKRHLHHRTHGIFSSTAGGQRQQRWYSLNSDSPPSLLRITHALHAFHKVKAERRADLSVKYFTVPFQLRPNCFVIVLPIFTTESTICRPKKQEALQTISEKACASPSAWTLHAKGCEARAWSKGRHHQPRLSRLQCPILPHSKTWPIQPLYTGYEQTP